MSPTRIRRPNRSNARNDRGYTLTELAVVMAVFMIFMSFAGPVMISHLMSAVRTERRVDLQQSARAALRYMEREMRQAKELYSSADKPSGRDRISFGTDLNGDGVINPYDAGTFLEQITYYVQGSTLYRGRKQGQGTPLAENVRAVEYTMYGSNPLFDLDSDGVVEESELNPPDGTGAWSAGELANVTRIEIELTVEEAGVTQTYTSDVLLRNKVVG
jgi:prepilin-type N-terminal cleavage/methylation domain-containing protein